jgi:CheY-like chemotaxis protein
VESVLLVDFVKENLLLTKDILRSKFEVFTADTEKKALKILADYRSGYLSKKTSTPAKSQETTKPLIILINYVIPNSSGVKALNKLTENGKDFLAMMMTNMKDMEIVVDAISHGFDGFVKIPVDLEKFEEQLEKAKKIYQIRIDADNYLKVKATKAMSITFAHYTRNLLTPLIAYLVNIEGNVPENIYKVFKKNLKKINELTYKIEELLKKGVLNEYTYPDKTEFYDLKLDDD